MKKNFKKTLARVTAVAMALSMVAVAPANNADAAKKKKPTLSKKATVTVKKTKKLKLKKTKGIKKTKWSVKKKSIATISKKKKTSVVVKGKKVGTTTVVAKVTVKGKKKPYTLKCKIKVKKAKKTVTKTTKTTQKATPTPAVNSKDNTNTNTKPEKKPVVVPTMNPKVVGGKEVDETQTVHIPVTALNETVATSNLKRQPFTTTDQTTGEEVTHDGNYTAKDTTYTKDGVTFKTFDIYTCGVMYYLDPITKEDELRELTTEEKEKNGNKIKLAPVEGKATARDISEFDYIRVSLKDTPREINVRLYENMDEFMTSEKGFPGDKHTAFYGVDSVDRGDYVKKVPIIDENGTKVNEANEYYADKEQTVLAGEGYAILPIPEVVRKAGKKITGIAICGQFNGQSISITDIELLKIKGSKTTAQPASIEISAADKKTAIVNGSSSTLQMSANVLNKNNEILEDETVTWSIEKGDAATIDAASGLLTANDKTGKVTVAATSVTDKEVKASYEVDICDPQTVLSVKLNNKYSVYTIDETKDGYDFSAQALNGAGVPVDDQSKVKVSLNEKSTEGYAYANGKLTAAKAGKAVFDIESGDVKGTTTIEIVEGQRVDIIEGTVSNKCCNDYGVDEGKESSCTIEDGVATLVSNNWSSGFGVQVTLTGGKTAANVRGLVFTLKSATLDGKQASVTVDKTNISKHPQIITEAGWAAAVQAVYTGKAVDSFANGVTTKAQFDYTNVTGAKGTETELSFGLGANAESQTTQLTDLIVLTGAKLPILSVSGDNTEVDCTDPVNLTATIGEGVTTPTIKSIEWKSSDEKVATVAPDSTDVSKAVVTTKGTNDKASENVTITAKATLSDNKTQEATFTITVKSTKPTAPITGDAAVTSGKTTDLTATFEVNAKNDAQGIKSVEWTSSNEEVATVAAKGTITSPAETATATVTAKTVTAPTKVTITAKITCDNDLVITSTKEITVNVADVSLDLTGKTVKFAGTDDGLLTDFAIDIHDLYPDGFDITKYTKCVVSIQTYESTDWTGEAITGKQGTGKVTLASKAQYEESVQTDGNDKTWNPDQGSPLTIEIKNCKTKEDAYYLTAQFFGNSRTAKSAKVESITFTN